MTNNDPLQPAPKRAHCVVARDWEQATRQASGSREMAEYPHGSTRKVLSRRVPQASGATWGQEASSLVICVGCGVGKGARHLVPSSDDSAETSPRRQIIAGESAKRCLKS